MPHTLYLIMLYNIGHMPECSNPSFQACFASLYPHSVPPSHKPLPSALGGSDMALPAGSSQWQRQFIHLPESPSGSPTIKCNHTPSLTWGSSSRGLEESKGEEHLFWSPLSGPSPSPSRTKSRWPDSPPGLSENMASCDHLILIVNESIYFMKWMYSVPAYKCWMNPGS